MTVMMHDAVQNLPLEAQRAYQSGDLADLAFADDTLLIMKNTRCMNRLLHEIELESFYYNMRLNKAKCEVIEMNQRFNVKFWDGTLMDKAEAVTYLGGKITQKANSIVEVSSRISATMGTLKQLELSWRQATTRYQIAISRSHADFHIASAPSR